jgi:hypothetical protein
MILGNWHSLAFRQQSAGTSRQSGGEEIKREQKSDQLLPVSSISKISTVLGAILPLPFGP